MAEPVHDAERLKELQALPLERKVQLTQTRIIEWYQHYNGNVCVSFSGGKDSTVLLHIARQIYPDIPAVFSNTGLEYPEIQQFVRSFDNVDIVVPEIRFTDVLTQYGYPLIGKEVAEAIYYARRIRSHSVNVERERELQSGVNETNCQEPAKIAGGVRRQLLHGTYSGNYMGGGTARRSADATICTGDSSGKIRWGGYTRAELRQMFPQGKFRRMLQPDPRDPMAFNFQAGGVHTTAKRTEFHNRRVGTSTRRDRDGDTNSTDSEPG